MLIWSNNTRIPGSLKVGIWRRNCNMCQKSNFYLYTYIRLPNFSLNFFLTVRIKKRENPNLHVPHYLIIIKIIRLQKLQKKFDPITFNKTSYNNLQQVALSYNTTKSSPVKTTFGKQQKPRKTFLFTKLQRVYNYL